MGRYVLATWLSRVGAQLIDGLIIGVGALILFLPIGAALGVGAASDSDTGIGAAIVGLLFWVLCVTIIAFLYAPILMARTNGKTLGRMAMNIRVVRTSGEPVTFWFAMLREVVVKSILFGIVELVHVRARVPARPPVAAVGRGEPRAARLHRQHAGREGLAGQVLHRPVGLVDRAVRVRERAGVAVRDRHVAVGLAADARAAGSRPARIATGRTSRSARTRSRSSSG